jgi:hypothetical protein
MSNPDLSEQYIKDTFDGILHMGGDPLPSTGRSIISDGVGNASSVSIGRTNQGISVSGTVFADKLYGFEVEAGQLKAGNVTYPNSESNQNLIDLIYPVGSVYFSTIEKSPASFFGGLWVRTAEGKFVGGVGTGTDQNGKTKYFGVGSGEGEYEQSIRVENMPSHGHRGLAYGTINDVRPQKAAINIDRLYSGNSGFKLTKGKTMLNHRFEGTDSGHGSVEIQTQTDGYLDGEVITENVGGGVSLNNIPPTFGLFVYTRTA